MKQLHRLVCAIVTFSIVSGCSSKNESGYVRPKGRGSAACQAWQKAFCDLVAVECNRLTEAECVDNYYSISCNSDEKAQSCATALDNATCATGLPQGCNLDDLADRQPAIDACNGLVESICTKAANDCHQGTVEECHSELGSSLDCSLAIGFTSGYDSCMSDISQLSCSAAAMPNSCKEVIKLH